MLASITPLGERGRRSRWSVTVAMFALGATSAATVLGVALGAAGAAIWPGGSDGRTRLALLAGLLALAGVADLLPVRIPGPRRQVNERWLDEFRGWVYGVGFGGQLGLAVTTVVSSAATYCALAAAVLSGSAARGGIIVGAYGAVRGLTPVAAAWVRRPEQLLELHRAVDRWRTPVARLVAIGLAVLAGVSLGLAL